MYNTFGTAEEDVVRDCQRQHCFAVALGNMSAHRRRRFVQDGFAREHADHTPVGTRASATTLLGKSVNRRHSKNNGDQREAAVSQAISIPNGREIVCAVRAGTQPWHSRGSPEKVRENNARRKQLEGGGSQTEKKVVKGLKPRNRHCNLTFHILFKTKHESCYKEKLDEKKLEASE